MSPDQLRVVYKDHHFLAVAKPPGIATTAPDDGLCLVSLVKQLDPRAPQMHPLSRLDTQVSGVLAFARTAWANQLVLDARRAGHLYRRYLGLTSRVPEPLAGDWRDAIAIDPRDPKKRLAVAMDARAVGVKQAHTRYGVRARAGSVVALDLWPQTGRTHQLRVHAAHAGSPLLGDVAYGGSKRLVLENGRILPASRVMLHCAEVHLPHPDTGIGLLKLELPPDADLVKLWGNAGGDQAELNPLLSPRT